MPRYTHFPVQTLLANPNWLPSALLVNLLLCLLPATQTHARVWVLVGPVHDIGLYYSWMCITVSNETATGTREIHDAACERDDSASGNKLNVWGKIWPRMCIYGTLAFFEGIEFQFHEVYIYTSAEVRLIFDSIPLHISYRISLVSNFSFLFIFYFGNIFISNCWIILDNFLILN